MLTMFQKHPLSVNDIPYFSIFRLSWDVKDYLYSLHKINKKTDKTKTSNFILTLDLENNNILGSTVSVLFQQGYHDHP
jgi:hypothetical protein